MFEQFGILPVDGGLYDQDMDFLTELRMARMARNDHTLLTADSEGNKALKDEQKTRKAEIARWRRGE